MSVENNMKIINDKHLSTFQHGLKKSVMSYGLQFPSGIGF